MVRHLVLQTFVCPACEAVRTCLVPPVITMQTEPPGLIAGCGFDDQTTSLLGTGFDKAWQALTEIGSPLAADPCAALTRELLAKCVIALARRGETDPLLLANGALALLEEMKPTLVSMPQPSDGGPISGHTRAA